MYDFDYGHHDDVWIINHAVEALQTLRAEEDRIRDLLASDRDRDGIRDGDRDGDRYGRANHTLRYARELQLVVCAIEGIERRRWQALRRLAGEGCCLPKKDCEPVLRKYKKDECECKGNKDGEYDNDEKHDNDDTYGKDETYAGKDEKYGGKDEKYGKDKGGQGRGDEEKYKKKD